MLIVYFVAGFSLGLSVVAIIATFINYSMLWRVIQDMEACYQRLEKISDALETMDGELEVIKFDLDNGPTQKH
jgi:hypothetical protein